jgi:hypothetical protein
MTMLGELRQLETSDLKRPHVGAVDAWVQVVVLFAIAATLAILVAGPHIAWERDAHELNVPGFWFRNALAIGFVTALVFALVPEGSRMVRIAVLLPVFQVAALIVTWLAWTLLRSRMPSATDATPLLEELPAHIVLPWLGLALAIATTIVVRRRKREWLHSATMLSLVFLLFLGLWLPFASGSWNGQGYHAWDELDSSLAHPAKMIAYVMVPPFVAATLFTASALRWPHVWRRNGAVVGVLLALALVIAIGYRADVTEPAAFVYLNFTHVIAAAALLAITAIVALGVSLWVGHRRARAMLDHPGSLTGTIVNADDVIVSCLQTTWLSGPRSLCESFVVSTHFGDVPVPTGARVIAATPPATTILHRGEAVPTLRVGDRVALAGYITAKTDGPFRATGAPIPGAGGVSVGAVVDEKYGLRHAGLDLWRPAVAYLLICVAVALPGLAALLSDRF